MSKKIMEMRDEHEAALKVFQEKIDAARKEKEFMQMCYEEVRYHLRGITETSRRDRDFK